MHMSVSTENQLVLKTTMPFDCDFNLEKKLILQSFENCYARLYNFSVVQTTTK